MKQLSLHGTAVEISGSGPPVVLLHGVGLNQSIWAEQVKALEGYPAAAPPIPRVPSEKAR